MSGAREIDELIRAALAPDGDDAYLDAVRALGTLGSLDVLFAMTARLEATDPAGRLLAADVLGRLGWREDRPYLDEVLPLLLDRSAVEPDAGVRKAVVVALGHLGDERAVPGIVRHVDDLDRDVRWAVAASLAPIGEIAADVLRGQVVPALATLVLDNEPDVRDWATFALAHHAVDGWHIRDLLLVLVDDPDECTRGEAIRGLARRHDRRVLDLLTLKIRAAPTVDELEYRILEAAEMWAGEELAPALHELAARSPAADRLRQALDVCDPLRRTARVGELTALRDGLERAGLTDVYVEEDRFDPSAPGEVRMCVGDAIAFDPDVHLRKGGGTVEGAVRSILATLAEVRGSAADPPPARA